VPPQNPVDRRIGDVSALGVKPSCPVALDDVVRPSGPVDVIGGHGPDLGVHGHHALLGVAALRSFEGPIMVLDVDVQAAYRSGH